VARTPKKRRRLTVVTAKIPNGIAEAKRKKLLTRTAIGLRARNVRSSSAGANGVAKCAPCRSIEVAIRPLAKIRKWTVARRRREGPRKRGVDFIM
jgi:hypothetical protein